MEHDAELGVLDPRPLLLKKFIWDIFPHDADIADVQHRLGLMVDTEDGMEVDHRASDLRIARIKPLCEGTSALSGYLAEVMGVYLVTQLEEMSGPEGVEIPDGFIDGLADQNHEIIYLGGLALIAHMLDIGVLQYGEKAQH
jgi:hypothetical protein